MRLESSSLEVHHEREWSDAALVDVDVLYRPAGLQPQRAVAAATQGQSSAGEGGKRAKGEKGEGGERQRGGKAKGGKGRI